MGHWIEVAERIVGSGRRLADHMLSSRSSRNVVWNLLGGLWTGVLTVTVTPWYVARLGMEGYGLLGLWLMMQVMMGLLDLGMGATLVREFANVGNGAGSEARPDLLRTLEYVYWPIAGSLALCLMLAARWLAESWLNTHSLPNAYVGDAIRLMSLALGLQFPCALYSNGLAGLQDQGRMNALQALGSGLRYGGGAAVLFWRADLLWFFAAQSIFGATQTLLTRRAVWRALAGTGRPPPAFRWDVIRRTWRFSLGMAVTASSGVLLANVDRLFLSRLASMAELGKYALAFTATGLLQMGIQPFYRAFFPRYSELVAAADPVRSRDEYFRSCKLLAAVLVPIGVGGWVFAPQVFHAWIGRHDDTIVAVFRWLLVGITTSGLMWLPAAFQQAHGWTRLHAAMIAGALLAGSPALVWTIGAFGAAGATVVWVLHGVSDITLGLWLMHRRLLPGEFREWYRSVLLPPLLGSIPLVALSWWLMPHDLTRWKGLAWVVATGTVLGAASLLLSLRASAGELSSRTGPGDD